MNALEELMEKFLMEEIAEDYKREMTCKCGQRSDYGYHTCPFAMEIHNDDDQCNCCRDCEHECAMDI